MRGRGVSMEMTLSNQYLNANLDILQQLGFPRDEALKVLTMDEADVLRSNDRLSIDKFLSCLIAASDYTSNQRIGLHMGLKFRVGGLGDTGSIYSYCDNLEEVMTIHNLYQRAAIDAGQIKYLQKPDGTHHMCFIPHYSDLARYRLITDVLVAAYVSTYRWLSWGGGEDIVCTQLPYVKAGEQAAYEDLLKTRIDLDAKHICLEFSELAMSQKLTTRDPERLARKRMTLDKIFGQQTASADFEKGVEAAIRGAIENGHVSAQIVADRMGLNASTFRTHLAATSEGMRPRVDRIRKAMFIEKNKAGLTFAQISHDLAYNDQAAMNRAFRRWFDMTPTQWLAKQQRSDVEA